MRPKPTHRHADWTAGPAGWAPILLLALLAAIGSMGAMRAPAINPDPEPSHSPIAQTRINVNTASEARLQLLPRIGPKMAGRIIEEREANGPFEDADDFQRVHGIGPKTAQRIAAIAEFSIDQ